MRSKCASIRCYNPEAVTQYNIVPGLMGVILTMTMVMMTGLAITRERERGTMENLLATPATALEVMTGKIVPYVLIGLVQVSIILILARVLFSVPMAGSLVLLFSAVLLFIAANLTLGLTFSSLARNQLQAMQMTFFFFLPSMLLSGFMFPFRGMPGWAQAHRRGAAADAFPAHRPRHPAEGQRARRDPARSVAAAGVHAVRDAAGIAHFPQHARLAGPNDANLPPIHELLAIGPEMPDNARFPLCRGPKEFAGASLATCARHERVKT